MAQLPVRSALQVGVSTSSCPGSRAREIADAVLSCGGDCVELRMGRRHAWESEGVSAVAAAGVTVTAIASSRTFGADAIPERDEDVRQAEAVGASLRCFLDARCEGDDNAIRRAQAQVATVQRMLGDHGAVLVEPHPGYSSLAGAAAFCASTGTRMVLDTFAVCRLGITRRQAFSELGWGTRVLHLKGFEQVEGRECRHRALVLGDLPSPADLGHAPELAAAVIETRAGSQWQDLRLLCEWARHDANSAAADRGERDRH